MRGERMSMSKAITLWVFAIVPGLLLSFLTGNHVLAHWSGEHPWGPEHPWHIVPARAIQPGFPLALSETEIGNVGIGNESYFEFAVAEGVAPTLEFSNLPQQYDVYILAERFEHGKEVIIEYGGKRLHINIWKLVATDDIRQSIYETKPKEKS